MSVVLNKNQQRLQERYNRQEQLIVPTTIRGKMRCPACKGERRLSHIEFLFNKDRPMLELVIVCVNTRCRITNGRPKNILFDLKELDDEGNVVTEDEASQSTTLSKLLNNNLTIPTAKDKEPDFFNQLMSIRGIGRKIATKLIDAGYTAKSLKNARHAELKRLGMTTKQVNIVLDAFQ